MRAITKSVLTIIFLFLFSKISSQKQNFEKQNEKTLKMCEHFIKQNDVPGMAVSISYMGKIIFSKGLGYSDIENKIQVDPSKTKFRIASITKTITSATLAKLVEMDSIDLKKSVYFYLDSLPKKKYDFTVKEVGGHLSGMIRVPSEEKWDDYKTYFRKDFYRVFDKDNLEFEPSSKFQYSNYGFKLLGLIIEKKCGKSLIECQKDLVIKKLNMNNTIPDTGNYDINVTKFYSFEDKKIIERPVPKCIFRYAEGCYLSTTEDLITLGNGFLYADRLIKKGVFTEFIKSQKLNSGEKTGYGIGFISSNDYYGNFYFGHNGKYIGGMGMLNIYPKEKLIVSILFNTDTIKTSLDILIQEIAYNYINEIESN